MADPEQHGGSSSLRRFVLVAMYADMLLGALMVFVAAAFPSGALMGGGRPGAGRDLAIGGLLVGTLAVVSIVASAGAHRLFFRGEAGRALVVVLLPLAVLTVWWAAVLIVAPG